MSFDSQLLQREIRIDWPTVNGGCASVPLRLPLDNFDGEVSEYSIAQLITKFHQPQNGNAVGGSGGVSTLSPLTGGAEPSGLMVILHNVLAERRVLFMGTQSSASDLVRYVLALCSLFTPALPEGGVIKRAFPYSSLGNLEAMLQTPGYIGGVLNPAFQLHDDWWDVLCDIGTGKVLLSPRLKGQSAYGYAGKRPSINGHDEIKDAKEIALIQSDNEFMQRTMEIINGKAFESAIKKRFTRYIRQFVQLAAWQQHYRWHNSGTMSAQITKSLFGPRFPIVEDGASQVSKYGKRIDLWLSSSGCASYRTWWSERISQRRQKAVKLSDESKHANEVSTENEWALDDQWDLERQVLKLRLSQRLRDDELEKLLEATLACLQSDSDVDELLAYLPINEGGLLTITQLLCHPASSIRQQCLQILQIITAASKVTFIC
jgi:hypothetical protein